MSWPSLRIKVVATLVAFLVSPALSLRPRQESRDVFLSSIDPGLAIPSSIASVLATGIPRDVQSAIGNIDGMVSVALQFLTGIPKWYSDLPTDVKLWVQSHGLAFVSDIATLAPLDTSVATTTRGAASPTAREGTRSPTAIVTVTAATIPSERSQPSVGMIIGITVAMFVAVSVAASVIYYICTKKKRQRQAHPESFILQDIAPSPSVPSGVTRRQSWTNDSL
ncbi:hypothetical protein FGG08_004872 [Glutinoglossum americanum]|uniref:Transmembrane protein n=1 Tax=Glutinoglossum americanum TaxID=1670608 RepID=A0A9P8I8B8_9PEZI|nr:hypothetical protein FGG08_004872 [Glutinoglossum americanum]